MLGRLTLLTVSLVTALWSADASAERRVAMVIGNSAYQYASTLRNPGNDANDVAQALKGLGFEVQLGVDLDQQQFARTIEQFARMLDDADIGLFFYAGHGVQMNDKNYLVSVNAKLENEFLLSSETIELDAVVRLMESKASVNLVFLDACRNNPLMENLRRSLTSLKRSAQLGRGLARIEPTGRDTLVAFAAAPGQEAADGAARNSPFTAALLRHIGQPGLEVSVMLKEVAADVRRDTRNSQRPQQLSDMSKAFYFAKLEQAGTSKLDAPPAPEPAKTPGAPGTDERAVDVAYWSAAQSANDCDTARAYLQRFPSGLFVELARLSERRLCGAARTVTGLTETPLPAQATTPTANAVAAAPAPAAAAPEPPVAVAALPQSVNAAPLPGSKSAAPGGTDLTRVIQLELIRLGCGPNEASGQWTINTREGLRKFNKFMHARLDLSEPKGDTIMTLQKRLERACPLECARGFAAKGNTCVAINPAPSKKNRRVERVARRHAPMRTREAAPGPVVQPAPAASPMVPMMGLGMGGLMFRFGHH